VSGSILPVPHLPIGQEAIDNATFPGNKHPHFLQSLSVGAKFSQFLQMEYRSLAISSLTNMHLYYRVKISVSRPS